MRDGRILGAGALEELAGWGKHALDERFADKVLMPGLVEGHSHAMEGTFWRYVYVGYFDRMDPHGKTWPGLKSIEAVIARLAEASAALKDPAAPLSAWSLDPIYFGDRRVAREDLDRASRDRPIGVLHASAHILNVNTKALELAGLLRKGITHPGIPLGPDGLPTRNFQNFRHPAVREEDFAGSRAIIDNRFKLVLDAGSRSGGEASRELFDLRADPAEKNNLIAAHPAEAERLAARLRAWQQSVLESLTGADYR